MKVKKKSCVSLLVCLLCSTQIIVYAENTVRFGFFSCCDETVPLVQHQKVKEKNAIDFLLILWDIDNQPLKFELWLSLWILCEKMFFTNALVFFMLWRNCTSCTASKSEGKKRGRFSFDSLRYRQSTVKVWTMVVSLDFVRGDGLYSRHVKVRL